MKYLNLGCGRRIHHTWTNIDFVSKSQDVIAHDLSKGIPFPDASFNVVYHSHLLEHFSKGDAERFLRECYRVLQPEGVLRVVVPDLEQMVRTYLSALENASSGSSAWAANHEWMLLEMYDQSVRNSSGGEIAAYLSREEIPNKEFILKRWGKEAGGLTEGGRKKRMAHDKNPVPEHMLKHLPKRIQKVLRTPAIFREWMFKFLLRDDYQALQIGRFRQGGEIHLWMYDRYSLAVLLERCGFQQIVQRSATESYLPDWEHFYLDTELDGTLYKPDSLYMEAVRE